MLLVLPALCAKYADRGICAFCFILFLISQIYSKVQVCKAYSTHKVFCFPNCPI